MLPWQASASGRTKHYLEIVTLSCQYHLVSPDLATVLRDKFDIVKKAVLVFIELPEVLHQLERMLLSYQVVRGRGRLAVLSLVRVTGPGLG